MDGGERLRSDALRYPAVKSLGLAPQNNAELVELSDPINPELTSNEGDNPGVAYQNTVALLIEAVKTLSAKVKELETK